SYCDCHLIFSIFFYLCPGIIRLPKAPKTPVKSKVVPRQSLAAIVKDLAISAPLKLKASRGPPTPINRNQASQPRVGQSLLGKRGFDSASGTPYPANGRPYTSGMRTTSQSVIKRQKVSQGEAPNPVVFVATKDTRYVCPQACTCRFHIFCNFQNFLLSCPG
ncbi:metastasis-associated protein MTA2-like, partial [Cynoglossus semilaevis]|uniref:metastasis-associated protein MTA2-like n=1 Tax=Cynoglossus semilaevis TaxID=244447 RepID=UPI000D626B1C